MAREMKNSGIEWIGEIPHKWELKRLKALFLERKEKNNPVQTDFILSLGAAYGVVPYSEKEGGGNKAKEDLTDYRLAYPNDIVMNSMNIISGSVGISKYFGCVSPVYYILYPRYDNISSDFFCYIFQTKAFQRSLLGLGNGILIKESSNGNFNTVRMRIPMEKLGVQLLPLPPLNEQQKIASFLDQKCAEIDAVIEKTKATIEEYKKLKQSVITEAVTKGIRGNRPMKDSGIEWIGEIPVGWETYRFKNIFSFGKGLPITKENLTETGLSVISYGQIHSKTNTGTNIGQDLIRFVSEEYLQTNKSSLVDKDDFIFADTSEDLDGCGNCVYVDKTMTLFAGYHTIVAFSNRENDNKYLAYLFKSDEWRSQIRSRVSGVKLFSISKKILANTTLILPPLKEEKEISDYLDQKCAEIDTLIAKKTTLLSEFENYKKSLIYEYVTGKKEVGELSDNTTITIVYPYFPAILSTDKTRFAQAVLMSKILDSNVKYMGRVKLEKMLFTIEHSLGFDFDTEYAREMAGPLDSSIYECEKIISRTNKWFYVNNSHYGTSYKPQKNIGKYKRYYEQYFSDYNEEIESIISVFKNYSLDQSEIIATLFAAWNDAIIDKKQFTDEDIVNDVLNNWHESKTRFSKDVWLRAMKEMRKNNLIPKGYGKKTVIKKIRCKG